MATNQKKRRPYMHWSHNEDGATQPRRFQNVHLHVDNYPDTVLKGCQVPYAITTHSGNGFSGEHEAHIYYERPDNIPNFHPPRKHHPYGCYRYEHYWLSPQNITNIAAAMVILGFLRFMFVGSVFGGY